MSIEHLGPQEAIHYPRDFEVGRVQSATELDPAFLKMSIQEAPAQIVLCDVYNPNIEYLKATKPGRYEEIQRDERRMNAASRLNYANWRNRRQRAAYVESADEIDRLDGDDSIAYGDTESRTRFFGVGGMLGDPALRLWRKMIPQASALTPLVNPFNTQEIINVKNGSEIAKETTTDTTKEWMTSCTDGQEIYHRSAIMVEEMGGFIGKYAAQHPEEKMAVVSVAGGTALSTMQAILRSGVDPANVRLVLLEGNDDSAQMAFDLAERIGFPVASIDRKTKLVTDSKGIDREVGIDVFSPADMTQVKQELDATGEKVVAVDAVGIVEYSNTKLHSPELEQKFGKDYMLYNPEAFIAACLNLVNDEGIAIVGQMRTDRPNPYFTRGVVSWPHLSMRSPANFARLLQGSGVNMDLTKFSLTPRNTYTMATMYKSDRAAHLAGFAAGETPRAEAAEPTRRSWMDRLRVVHHAGSTAASSEIV